MTQRQGAVRRPHLWLSVVVLGAVIATLSACGSSTDADPTSSTTPPATVSATSTPHPATSTPPPTLRAVVVSDVSTTTIQPQATAGSCHVSGASPFVLPDPTCTPGAITAAVTQANAATTICTSGYTTRVAPTGIVRTKEGEASRAAYGYPIRGGGLTYGYLVPIDLGGSLNDPRNSWPQGAPVLAQKAKVAGKLLAHVCDGTLSLAAAQSMMATNWLNTYIQYVGPLADVSVTPSPGGVRVGAVCDTAGAIATDSEGGQALCAAASGSLRWTADG